MPPILPMLKTVAIASLVVTIPIVGIRALGGFQNSELRAYDEFMQWRPEEPVDDRVVIVTIDDTDIETLQQYPIYDSTMAEVLATLDAAEPAAIGLDISRDIPHGPPAGRKRLAQVIADSPSIISGCLLSTASHPGSPPAPGTPNEAAAFADLPLDSDQVVRRIRLVSTPATPNKPPRKQHICNQVGADNELPSLSFQLAQMYLTARGIEPQPSETGELTFRQQRLRQIRPNFGGYINADVADYQLMLNYRGSKRVFRQIPFLDVLRNQVDPQLIKGRVVLIGMASEVSKDDLPTPYVNTEMGVRRMLGVVVHAHAVSQILSAVLDQRLLITSWPEAGKIGWIWLWALGGGVLAFYNRRLGLFFVGLVGSGLVLLGCCYGLFLTQGVWVPWIPTLFATVITGAIVRVVDLGDRSGYTQAVLQQLREQMQGQATGGDRQSNYLESLVLRARAVRQGQDASALLEMEEGLSANATPEMRALYEKLSAKAKAEMAATQAQSQVAIAQPSSSTNKSTRLQSLVSRSKQTRNHPHPPS